MNVQTTIFSSHQISLLDSKAIPAHIAIMPDGNRRWAKKHSKTVAEGYRVGADNLLNIVKAAKEMGIKVITFYVFSTENWNRPALEVKTFMWLLESYLIDKRGEMIENGVKLQSIGDPSALSKSVRSALIESKAATAHCNDIEMVLAINYGARDEIRRAVKSIVGNKISTDQITEDLLAKYLDTSKWPDPDLLIRTSGEMRISNFLLWQTSYAEFYSTELFWPEFTPLNLLEAILHFQKRQRRLGGK